MEELRNEIISRVRSCLISTKGQITLRQLESDYRTLLGERIPYQKLGYKTLENFIQSVPTLTTTRGPNGELFVDAKSTAKTAHISDMVKKQKSTAKKRVRISQPPSRLTKAPPHHPGGFQKWRPKKTASAAADRRHIDSSPRLAAVSHNQFVSSPVYKKPKVPSRVVVVEKPPPPPPEKNPPTPPVDDRLRRFRSSPEKVVENGNSNSSVKEWEDNSTPISNTMRRISKIMSEMSVERDSGNSSPTTDFKDEPLVEFIPTGDPIQDLRRFAEFHKLGPVDVRFTETKAKRSKVIQYHCKITVLQRKFSSYPEEFYDKKAAELRTSQRALDDLKQKYTKRRSMLVSSTDDIIERIPPMLEKYNTAVWMWQIEADYEHKYNELLPSDWLQIVDNCPQVSIEKYVGGRSVLMFCSADEVLQKGKRLDVSLNEGDVSVPCNTVRFGDNNRLVAVVTVARSVNEIWFHCIGIPEHDSFLHMLGELQHFYDHNYDQMVAQSINCGSCYVCQTHQGWARVRAISAPKDGFVDCFMIDWGDELRVPVDKVYKMKREYAREEAQAFVCRLSGLEEFYEVSVDCDHFTLISNGQELLVEMVPEDFGNDQGKDVTIPVVVYESGTQFSWNQELMTLLAIDSAIPSIDEAAITEIYVANIESNGDIYIQVRTPGFHHLMGVLDTWSEYFSKNVPKWSPPQKKNHQGQIYLVEDNVTGKWLRATIIDWSPNGDLAQIYFIDQGNTNVISVANQRMYLSDHYDASLSQYQPQALKVRVMIDKIPGDFVSRAEKLLPREQPVLLKVISYDNEGVAWVELFKRTTDGVLVFINKNIAVEDELMLCSNNNNNDDDVEKKKRLIKFAHFSENSITKPVPSGGYLKKPQLPKKGDYFNVKIPFSVNPWNFFIQPLHSYVELTTMMAEMQENYKDVQHSPLHIDDIIPGQIYASRHDDGLWYRTSVLKVIHQSSISVFYCDFGYYTSLTLQQLIPLDPKFMSLPYQALKAKIEGIKPVKNKWTMEDCDTFNNLVMKKQFVSILVDIEKDELYKSDLVLQLLLIDTTSDKDVYIKDLLIEKGIATY